MPNPAEYTVLMARKPMKKRQNKTMKWIGIWATVWWAITGLYLVLLFWAAKDIYVDVAAHAPDNYLANWASALGTAYNNASMMLLLAFIAFIWLIGGLIWLRELKRQGISYAKAFWELFFTIK